MGIPVALSTDDRGMWDSNMTDEFFVAVREFNLSWEEIVKLGRNSLQYSFLDEPTKQRLLANYDKRIAAFALQFQRKGWAGLTRRQSRELRLPLQTLPAVPVARNLGKLPFMA